MSHLLFHSDAGIGGGRDLRDAHRRGAPKAGALRHPTYFLFLSNQLFENHTFFPNRNPGRDRDRGRQRDAAEARRHHAGLAAGRDAQDGGVFGGDLENFLTYGCEKVAVNGFEIAK